MRVGVVVGRFQIDSLHPGHDQLLRYAGTVRSDILCVVLGVNDNRGSRRNPLDFITRKLMIEEWHRDSGLNIPLVVFAQQDQISDEVWSRNLDSMLRAAFPGASITLYGGRDSFLPYYKGSLTTEDVTEKFAGYEAATTNRKLIAGNPVSSMDFRRGVIYGAYNQWPRTIMCVDVAVYNSYHDVLVIGKRKDENAARFFGGFVDQADPSLEHAAKREAEEEANLCEPYELEFVGSAHVPDYRYKCSDDGLIMTSLFVAKTYNANLKAGDDMDELFRITQFSSIDEESALNMVMPGHKPLMSMLIKHLRK